MKEDKNKISFGKWLWYCFVVAVLLFMVPVIIGGLGLIASVFIPLMLIAIPIMFAAFVLMIIF